LHEFFWRKRNEAPHVLRVTTHRVVTRSTWGGSLVLWPHCLAFRTIW